MREMQRRIRVVAQHVHRPIVGAVVIARHVAAAQYERHDAEGGGVDGERPKHRRAETSREHRQSHLAVRLPAAVPKPAVFVRHVRLNARLDDVDRVSGDPRAYPGHAARHEQHRNAEMVMKLRVTVRIPRWGRGSRADAHEQLTQVLVGAEIHPETRRLATRRDREPPKHAAHPLGTEDLHEAVDGARVRVTHVREPEARFALTLDLHPGLGQLHRAADDGLRKTGERARPEVRPQTRFVAHVPVDCPLDAEHDGVYECDPVERRREALVQTFHLERQAGVISTEL